MECVLLLGRVCPIVISFVYVSSVHLSILYDWSVHSLRRSVYNSHILVICERCVSQCGWSVHSFRSVHNSCVNFGM